MKKPITYFDWLKVTAKGCLLAWRNIPELAASAWGPLTEFAYEMKFILLALVMPFLTPFAPIIAFLLRREYRRRVDRSNEMKDRFRSNVQYRSDE